MSKNYSSKKEAVIAAHKMTADGKYHEVAYVWDGSAWTWEVDTEKRHADMTLVFPNKIVECVCHINWRQINPQWTRTEKPLPAYILKN